MTTYNETLIADRKREEQAALDRRNAEAWEAILRTFPMDRPGEAHYKMLLEYCQNEITIEKASRFFATPPDGVTLRLISLQKARQQIIDEICGLESEQRITEFQARQNRIKYSATFSLGQLRARLVELMLKAEWSKKTVPEIHAELATIRTANNPVWRDNDGRVWEKLPATLDGLPAADFIKWSAKHDYPKFKQLVSRYGTKQCTAAMNQ
jgi:hypothetical protein